jgi:hypothetical protein
VDTNDDGTKILREKQLRVESNEVVEIPKLNAQEELLFCFPIPINTRLQFMGWL